MAKGAVFDNDLLKLIFQATNIPLLADNTVTGALTVLYVSLHTADPTAAGNQLSSEVAYTNYARAQVTRNSGGWTVTGNSVSPFASITFPAGGVGGSPTVAFFAIGTSNTGNAGKILYTGGVQPNITTGNGVTPILTTISSITES